MGSGVSKKETNNSDFMRHPSGVTLVRVFQAPVAKVWSIGVYREIVPHDRLIGAVTMRCR